VRENNVAKAIAKSLKRQNVPPLAAVLTCNLMLFVAMTRGSIILDGIRERSFDTIVQLAPAGLALLVVSMLSHQLSPNAKARIVFLRWLDPLPGARAFSLYAERDARIDLPELARRFGPLPTTPREQNVLWYKLYRTVEDNLQVRDANQQYLLWRDSAAILLLLAIALVPTAAFLTRALLAPAVLLALLLTQLAFIVRAARLNGERLITNVLALVSS
jgi:uncharacterized membrane protein YqaE (UPF0057 family)